MLNQLQYSVNEDLVFIIKLDGHTLCIADKTAVYKSNGIYIELPQHMFRTLKGEMADFDLEDDIESLKGENRCDLEKIFKIPLYDFMLKPNNKWNFSPGSGVF